MKFNKLVPELSVSNFKKSLDFYTNILGFDIVYMREEDKFAFVSFQGSQFMIEEINSNWSVGTLEQPFGRGINFQITINDVTALYKKVKESNLTLFKGLETHWYRQENVLLGCKEFLIQDPDGYLLRFSQDVGEKEL